MMSPEQVERNFRAAGLKFNAATTGKLVMALIRQARAEALEEAARVTDPKEPCGRTDYEKQAYGLRLVIAGAIRSLGKEK